MKKSLIPLLADPQLAIDYARFMAWFGYENAVLSQDFSPDLNDLIQAVAWTDSTGRGVLMVRYVGPSFAKPEDLSDEYAEHSRSHSLIMAVVASLVKGVREHGCAPLAQPGAQVLRELAEMGCQFRDKMGLDCSPAVLTVYPDTAGCLDCSLSSSCPKKKGRGA